MIFDHTAQGRRTRTAPALSAASLPMPMPAPVEASSTAVVVPVAASPAPLLADITHDEPAPVLAASGPAIASTSSVNIAPNATTRTPRYEFTCVGLMPKPPRYWTTLADVMPALQAYARERICQGESLDERQARLGPLDLPLLDARCIATRQERDRAAWRGRTGVSVEPRQWGFSGPSNYGATPMLQIGHDDANGAARDLYDDHNCRADLLIFLHGLYCLVEGKSEHLGFEFHPKHITLCGGAGGRTFECFGKRCLDFCRMNAPENREWHEASQQWMSSSRNFYCEPCDRCGAGEEEECEVRTSKPPRDGKDWWQVFERELSGKWPSWWSGGRGLTNGCKGYPRSEVPIVRRKQLQLRLLLARMVLNRGDTLAIRAFVLNFCKLPPAHTVGYMPTPSKALTRGFHGTIYFSHCYRCGLPWSSTDCTFDLIRAELLRDLAEIRRTPAHLEYTSTSWEVAVRRAHNIRVKVDADGNLTDPADQQRLPDWGRTLKHDHRYPGLPMDFEVTSRPDILHFLGHTFRTSDFALGDFVDSFGMSGSNRQFLKEEQMHDPPIGGYLNDSHMTVSPHFDLGLVSSPAGTPSDTAQIREPTVRSPEFLATMEHVRDVHIDNPGGRIDIFYKRPLDPFSGFFGRRLAHTLGDMGPMPRPAELRPAVDSTPKLLEWAQQCTIDNGISVPYLEDGFKPASVQPTPTAQAASPMNAFDDDEISGLPPLQAQPMANTAYDPDGDGQEEHETGDEFDGEFDG